MLTTFYDLTEHLLDYAGVDPSAQSERFARRAAAAAINSLPQMRRWQFYYSPLLINTVATQSTGTIAYDHTGGASERMVTLTGATWPAWVTAGVLRIGTRDFEIATQVSSTVITLPVNSNPGADVASSTEYILYRDAYPLPADFMAMGEVYNATLSGSIALEYVYPGDWHDFHAPNFGPALPYAYTIMGSRNYLNTMSMFLYPAPGSAYTLACLYQRSMRPIRTQNYSTGTVTVAADSTTVTGNGTAWTSAMQGAVIRFTSSATVLPTSQGGDNPFEVERIVASVASETSLTLDAVTGKAYTAKKYRISDAVDIREGQMSTLLLRECERQFRTIRRMEPTKQENEDYQRASILAFENDSVSFQQQSVYMNGNDWYQVEKIPLSDFP